MRAPVSQFAAASDCGGGRGRWRGKGRAFWSRLRWCSARTRAGARQPEVTAAACAQWWSRRNKGAGTAAPSVCVHGIQHSRGRGIAAMLAKLRRSRATMASGGNRKWMATTFGSCTKMVEQGIPRANYDVHRPSAGSSWWLARMRLG